MNKNTLLKVMAGILCMVLMAAGDDTCAQKLTASEYPSLISAIRQESPLFFCDEKVPLDQQTVRERFEKELLLSLWDRAQAILWMKRASRYFPHIEKMLKQHQLPADLKYVAIVESALQPHVGSSKGALGFWQFTKSTGRNYGLTINSEIDERRNIFTATNAAMTYFKALYDLFGSWTLAAAAYNVGENRIETEIIIQQSRDYYQLYLPLETQRYIFKIIAAKLILSAPGKYGFDLGEKDSYPRLQFDRVQLETGQKIPIQVIAQAAETNFKAIKDLNPQIRGYYLGEGTHEILVPKGAGKAFRLRYEQLLGQWIKEREKSLYVVRKGDNLSSIANRFNVPLNALFIWNEAVGMNADIYPGDQLIVYPNQQK